MKRSIKLFNKPGKNPRRRDERLDNEYLEDEFEDLDEYDEDDYPDEEFEQEYGETDDYQEDSDEADDLRDEEDYREVDEDFEDYEDYREVDEDYRESDEDEDYSDDYDDYSDDDDDDDIGSWALISDDGGELDEIFRGTKFEKKLVLRDDAFDDYYRDEDEDYTDEDYPDEADEEYDREDEDEDYPEDGYEDEDYPEDDYPDEDYAEDEEYSEVDYDGEYEDDYAEDDYEDEEYVPAAGFGRNSGRRDSGRDRRADRERTSRRRDNKRRDKHNSRRDKRDRDSRRGAGLGGKIITFFRESSFAERAAAVVAILILAAGIATMAFYSKALNRTQEIGAFAEVGANLNVNDVVGSTGLVAVADAERAKAMTADIIVEEEEEEEIVPDDAQGVAINMTLTTIKSDMKVKFINSQTNKLVADVPFTITVTTPDGTNVTYDDHDKDGIIYKKDLTAGKYKVTPNALPSDYSNYKLDTSSKSITIKDTVEMKAVDVSNEIKKESQVNAAVEDTAVQTVVESELKDTVDWDGESYVKEVDGDGSEEYKEVDKSSIVNPNDSGMLPAGSVRRLAASRTENPDEGGSTDENNENKETGESTGSNSGEGSQPAPSLGKIQVRNGSISLVAGGSDQIVVTSDTVASFSSSDSSVVTVTSTGLVKAVGKGTAVITVSAEGYESETVDISVEGPDEPAQNQDDQNKEKEKVKLPLSCETSMTLEVGKTAKITSSDTSIALNCTSDNTSVAVVEGTTIKAIAEGTAKITVSNANYLDAEIAVTVKAAGDDSKDKIPLSATALTIHERKSEKITSTNAALKLTFKSDNTKVATVAADGKVTGVTAGSATITVSAEGYANTTVTVTVIHKELKDKENNTLYVYENGKYRVATYADYDTATKFYKKVSNKEKKYHGWATIDGKTYFFDNSGNMVTGEQVIGGARYTFGSDGVLSASSGTLGIDVSKWNGNIDWAKVKNAGVNYVIIRCGYRGSSAGALIEDPKFKANIKGASAAGLRVGVYFFSQAVNEVEAVEEASMCINLVKGYSLSFPIYIDVEGSNGRGDAISASQRTANIKAFCGTIQSAGYSAGVYSNKTWFTSKINTGSLTNYKIWLAQYAAAVTYNATRYDMWQYTSKGTVSGISGKVDMNILYR